MSLRDRLLNAYGRIAEEFNTQQDQIVARYPDPYGQQPYAGTQNNFGYPSPQQYPLDLWQSVTLDSNGNGIASLGPQRVREHWILQSCWVGVAGFTAGQPNATAQLFLGSNALSQLQVANTINGSQGDTCALGGRVIQPGYQVWVKWSAGPVGGLAQMHLIGTYQIGSERLYGG